MSRNQVLNLFFYTRRPNDQLSYEFLKELDNSPLLKSQIKLIDIDTLEKIPDKILKINKIPILITGGINEPITGDSIISWLKNGKFQGKSNGFEFGNFENDLEYSSINNELKQSKYNQSFNKDYNLGFVPKDKLIKDYSEINQIERINEIYDISNQSKIKENDIKRIKNERDEELKNKSSFLNSTSLPFKIPSQSQPQNQSQPQLPFKIPQRNKYL
jgi:hypothetical protein